MREVEVGGQRVVLLGSRLALLEGGAPGIPRLAAVTHYVVIEGSTWEVYEASGGALLLAKKGPWEEVRNYLRPLLCSLKPPASAASVEALFSSGTDGLERELLEALEEAQGSAELEALLKAYEGVLAALYGRAVPRERLAGMLAKHSLMQMIAMISLAAALRLEGDLLEAASGALAARGLGYEVALPHLNWWLLSEEGRRRARRVAEAVAARIRLLDWEAGSEEDAFRTLYEALIEKRARREIGEYYTPPWLVDRAIARFELKGKTVMDPFCGSGTFLVRAFYKKLEEGERPEEAYGSLVGFDVNPLAVVIARAALIMAYRRAAGSLPPGPPRVYLLDTLAAWFGGRGIFLEGRAHERLAEGVAEIARAAKGRELGEILSLLSSFEALLHASLREAELAEQRGEAAFAAALERGIARRLGGLASKASALAEGLEGLRAYGGAWAAYAASLLSSYLFSSMRPDYVITNPPWLQTSSAKAEYVKRLREELTQVLERQGVRRKKAADIVNGSDIACGALLKALRASREGVAFVMYREQSFRSGSSMNAGIITTFMVLEEACKDCYVELVEVDYDAFGHGMPPALVIARKGSRREARLARAFLEGGALREEVLPLSYEEYMEAARRWALEDERVVAERLGAEELVPKATYITGLYGGHKARGRAGYAGLVLRSFREQGGAVELELYNALPYAVPKHVMEAFAVGAYRLLYLGTIRPFRCDHELVLLSRKGWRALRAFLEEYVRLNEGRMSAEDRQKIMTLAEEARAGFSSLDPSSHYVTYRASRAFVACVPADVRGSVAHDSVAYIKLRDSVAAHYYAGALNYLAYLVVREGRSFIRKQAARPAMAIAMLGLSTREVGAELVGRVAELSRQLALEGIEYPEGNSREALEFLYSRHWQFREIVEAFDDYLMRGGRQGLLERALDMVSARPSEGP
ncbi:MAG: SAM-dependent methyltransferase [Acidilobaceae archaeon]|nr:SAM-dependent methyltransferase [Acidilobaceae archaeon]